MLIRPMTDEDVHVVLALNEASVQALSQLGEVGLARHRIAAEHTVVCEVDEVIAAFAFAYGPRASYDSANYSWHRERFEDFVYLDRIAVSTSFRRRGIATALYDEIETYAAQHGRMVCEVNSDPPNVESLAFHDRRGYREIGHLIQPDGHTTVMLEKPL